MPDLASIPIPAVRLDDERRVVDVNEAACLFRGRVLPERADVELPTDAGLGVFRLQDAGDGWYLLTDVTDFRRQYEAIAEVSNSVLSNAESFRHETNLLGDVVKQQTVDLQAAYEDTVTMLAVASEAKDQDTGEHVRRIRRTVEALAIELGEGKAVARRIGIASVLHDIGKIHVPDAVLKKPGKLDQDERRIIERHTIDGERILGDNPTFDLARRIARHHHENWDGTGYPDGVAGESIPVEANLTHVADVFDALTNRRVYKPAWTNDNAAGVIRESIGLSFAPDAVAAFDRLWKRGFFEPDAQP
ncbi:MAG: HD domain-containing phosphohydrolase [Planctomycetota bacterium]